MNSPAGSGPAVARMGGGGWPPPPSLLFSRWGVPSPPCAGPTGGTPSPSGPRPGDRPKSKKNRKSPPPRRRFHANHRFRSCKKGAGCGHGGGGVAPTPPLFFFPGGGYPPPSAGPTGGLPPSP